MFSIIAISTSINKDVLELIEKLNTIKDKNFELILVVNKNNLKINNTYDFKIKVIKSNLNYPGNKRHLGVFHSNNKILAFIDDDATPSENWLKVAENKISANVSITGPAINIFEKKNSIEESFFLNKLTNYFDYRFKEKSDEFEVDDFHSVNFFILKKDYLKTKGFRSFLWPGEDTLLADRLKKSEIKIKNIGSLIVYHKRRSDIKKFIKQHYRYGYTRAYLFKAKIQNSFKIIFLLPSIFIFYLLFVFVLSIFKIKFIYLLSPYFIYLIIILLIMSLKKNVKIALYTIISTFIVHFFYGLGFIRSFFSKKYKQSLGR